MKNHPVEKIAALVCALCLAGAVMRGVVLAKDVEPAVAPPAEPEATFVVLDEASDESAGAVAEYLAEGTPVPTAEVTDNRDSVPYFVNGEQVGVCPILGGEPYVNAEEFCWALGFAVYGARTSDAYTLSGDGIYLEAKAGQIYFLCNNRYILTEQGLRFQEGQAMLPLQAMAKCLGVGAAWDRVRWTVTVHPEGAAPLENGDTYYQDTDLYWLSRVIYAEAGDQPFTGQLAVGAVVLNRVGNESYPDQNNVYDVIFAKNQFDVVINGMIYMEPDETAVVAAKLALEGYDVVSGATLFGAAEQEGYECVARIGDYCFMAAA